MLRYWHFSQIDA